MKSSDSSCTIVAVLARAESPLKPVDRQVIFQSLMIFKKISVYYCINSNGDLLFIM